MTLIAMTALFPVFLVGCGGDETPSVPTEGEALKEHLLDMLQQRDQATLAGDLEQANAILVPYKRGEEKAKALVDGRDLEATTVPQSVRDQLKRMGSIFDTDLPVTMDTQGIWARLIQERTDDLGEPFTARAFFLRDEGQWWLVSAVRDYSRGAPEGYGFTEAKNYWPDRMTEYFFLPPVKLKLQLVGKAESAWEDFRVRASVTNVSGRPISALQMRRFFTVVNYQRGRFSTAVEPRGKGMDPRFKALPPGQTAMLGEFDVSYPARDPEKGLIWREGPYLSNRLILPSSGL